MKIPKNLKGIKKLNIELINSNFKLNSSQLSKLNNSLKCDESACAAFNEKALKERDFIYCYLPLPTPKLDPDQKVSDFFICKEPSSKWANKKQSEAWGNIIDGKNINFIGEKIKLKNLQILFVSYFEVFPDGKFYITDLSKCAINVKDNKINSLDRYKCCQSLIELEIIKFTDSSTRFYLVGDNKEESYKSLKLIIGDRKIINIPHYAIQISCPEFLNRMYFDEHGINEKEIIQKIKTGFKQLGEKLSNNFNLNFVPNIIEKENIPPTNLLLYLIYKSCFERNA